MTSTDELDAYKQAHEERWDGIERVIAAAAERARMLAAEERRLIAEDAVEVDVDEDATEVVVRADRPSGDVVISRKGRSSFSINREPELLDEDARGLKDDGDLDGSWADLADRELDGVYDSTVEGGGWWSDRRIYDHG